MFYEVCIETMNRSYQSVAVCAASKREAARIARNYRAVRNDIDPVVYTRRIGEYEYYGITERPHYNDCFAD